MSQGLLIHLSKKLLKRDIYYFLAFFSIFKELYSIFFIKWAAKLKTFFDSANFIIYFFQNIFS